MKNIFSLSILTLALVTSMSSCLPDPIDIDVPPAEQKTVVSSQIVPNQIMVVGLSRSFSALSSGANEDSVSDDFLADILIDSALVTVEHPAGLDTLYKLAPGIYASIDVLLVNYGNYTLHVLDYKTGKSVKATTYLSPQVAFDSVAPYFQIANGDTSLYVHYEMRDDQSRQNYYVVNYYRKSQGDSTFDINSYFQRGQNQLNSFDLLSDVDFDGDGYLAKNRELFGIGYNDTIAVTVSNISQGYYEFLSAFKRSGSFVNQLSGEPINYPTNVENGYGYFNAHYPTISFFELVDYH